MIFGWSWKKRQTTEKGKVQIDIIPIIYCISLSTFIKSFETNISCRVKYLVVTPTVVMFSKSICMI